MKKCIENTDKLPVEVQKNNTAIIISAMNHHQRIIKLADENENLFNIVILTQFLGSLIILCMQLYQLSIVSYFFVPHKCIIF